MSLFLLCFWRHYELLLASFWKLFLVSGSLLQSFSFRHLSMDYFLAWPSLHWNGEIKFKWHMLNSVFIKEFWSISVILALVFALLAMFLEESCPSH